MYKDTVSRKGQWMIIERLGSPQIYTAWLSIPQNQRRDLSGSFPIFSSVKQGCVQALTLFSIFFSTILKHFTEDLGDDGAVYIPYRLEGSLFNLRTLKVQTKTLEQLFRGLIFVTDAALVACTEKALQHLTSCFAEASLLFGLEVSLKKTDVLHQPPPP